MSARNKPSMNAVEMRRMKASLSVIFFALLILFSIWFVEMDIFELIQSMPIFFHFLFTDFFPPNISDLDTYIGPVVDTLIFAVVTTSLSSLLGIVIGFCMAHNTTPHPAVRIFFRGIIAFLRNIPFLVWASILVVIFGVGTMPGLFALVLFGTSFLARVYAESIEELNKEGVEALDACGASYLQKIKHGIMPQFLPSFYSWTLFMFEINIRASAILGLVGAGGMGSILKQTMDLFQYGKTSTVIAIMVILILMVEYVTNRVRERLI
ncbi:phosphonate ABC transporter, permease protein PhnE [Niallia taxi]|uniref:phosphonate ABC transporter, permease protein PhnE n=1 Tax=Niallia taxi TaxID=2499688 RepID=UPI0011A5E50C|nr:phosphonate ABC transporter, permease protein PhnE [Niallia taxi]MCT2345938.1 phosphonate ABC transporter, permease protein PhnE [Niallia taxi]MDE5053611.1 phosphonate ABC transporter, permease protein PhnE [Niallia taxi]MDK8642742.1 phosphonate ABC transporter, permease protein PhnE [Niallia taxi]MED3964358.1 phosphonate ABC transporter, permease protein PhnE [Niallia taxi]MED4038794.1 phosphonate ABC transporter, permease protein PhnE [Niallia taxi]